MIEEKENFNTTLDLGRLAVFDSTTFNNNELELNEDEIVNEAEKNLKLIFTELYKLKNIQNGEEKENVDYDKPLNAVKLPFPSTILPRSKAIPKHSKTLTKWEEFAKERGISKKKKARMVYSEKLDEYLPRWGKNSVKKMESKADYILEDKPKFEGKNPFTMQKQESKLKVLKNKKQEEDNKEKYLKKKREKDSKLKGNIKEERKKLEIAQKSTASLGRFDKKLKNEQKINPLKYKKVSSDVFSSTKAEKSRDSKLLSKIIKKGE